MDKPVIVIVEDDEKSRRLMHDVLVYQGYEVVDADRGETGLDLIRARHPALVLMDIHLPGISGLDAIRAIRADPAIAATPVVAVTAAATSDAPATYRDAGFDGFQPKPLAMNDFLGTIRRLVPL